MSLQSELACNPEKGRKSEQVFEQDFWSLKETDLWQRKMEKAEKAYTLYEKFRQEIPLGKKGWGASGKLDLDLIRRMASA